MLQTIAITSDTSIEMVRDLLAAQRDALSKDQLVLASEIAYRALDVDAAVVAMEAAVGLSPLDGKLHFRLGLFRTKIGHEAAATSFNQAIACEPTLSQAYQALISLALAERDFGSAVYYARAQARACGASPDLVLQTANLLLVDRRLEDALSLLQRFNATDATLHSLRMEASIASQLGVTGHAIDVAARAHLMAPEDVEIAVLLSQLYFRETRFTEAGEVIRTVLRHVADNPRLHHILSATLSRLGDGRAALAAAIAAVQISPETSEYWYNAGMLAHTLGFTDRATALLARSTELEPDSANLWAAYARLLHAIEKPEEAVAALDRAIALSPDDAQLRDFRIYVLSRRSVVDIDEGEPRAVRPLPRSKLKRITSSRASVLTARAAHVQFRVLAGLTARAVDHRTIRSKFGLLSAIFEPLIQVLAVGAILSLFNRSRPPLGNYFFFFYATGLMPLYLFVHIVNHTLEIFKGQAPLLQIPIIKRLDIVIGEALAELLICGATTLLIFAGFELLGLAPRSDNQIQAVAAYMTLFVLAFGIGLIGAVANNFMPMYARFWGIFQRSLYFVSGVIILAEHMPLWMRVYLVWNPLLLLITWFRTGFFPQYDPPWLDKGYVLMFAFGCVALGLVLERASRRNMKMM